MAERLTMLIENMRGQGPTFELDSTRYAQVAARWPTVARRVDVVFSYDGDRFQQAIGSADVLVGFRLPFRDLPRIAPKLKWLHLTGAGINHLLPFDWVPPGLLITNNRGVHAPKVAEFCVMAVLMLNSAMPTLMTHQRQRVWKQ